jgi:ligand-binding SRPBCC domain-containing protein
MKVHRLEREQLLGGSLDEVFAFFTDVRNLERITPPQMGFRILTPQPMTLGPGAVIDYSIRLAGLPVRWRTRIVEWEPPHRFSDVQDRGPYARWEHTHSFERRETGVLMRDDVRYALPLGPLGALAHAVAVRRSLARIFDYRNEVLGRRFPVPASSPRGR